MFIALFNLILNLLATIIQIIVLPLNLIIEGLLPDLSEYILNISNAFQSLFNYMLWPLSQLPEGVLFGLVAVLTCIITLMMVSFSIRAYISIWTIIQKIKFW